MSEQHIKEKKKKNTKTYSGAITEWSLCLLRAMCQFRMCLQTPATEQSDTSKPMSASFPGRGPRLSPEHTLSISSTATDSEPGTSLSRWRWYFPDTLAGKSAHDWFWPMGCGPQNPYNMLLEGKVGAFFLPLLPEMTEPGTTIFTKKWKLY